MVTKVLHTVTQVEKEAERLAGASNNTQDPADQAIKEMRRLAEMTAFSVARTADTWGKKALDKTKEFTEEILQ